MALTADSVQQQLDNFFATIATKVAGDVVGKALPLIGKLTDMPGVAEALDPFATLKQKIHDAVETAKSAAGDPGQAIANAITSAGIPGVVSATWSSATGLDVTLHADKTVTTGTKLVDLGDSVGSFLDFDVNAGATFVATLDTTVSFGTDGTVSLKDQATPDVDVKIGTDLSVVDAGASLGVATVTFNDADPARHELNADFGLDLKLDGAGNFTVDPTLSGSAGLDLKFATTNVVAGLLPDVKGEFVVDFGVAGGDFAAPTIAVNHLTVDLSSYLGIVGSTFTDIAKTFNSGALGTMIDIATEPVPAFDGLAHTFGLLGLYDKVGNILGGGDGHITLGDLAVAANPSLEPNIKVWYQVIDLISKIRQLGAAGDNDEIDFGGGTLVGGVTQSTVDPAALVAQLKGKLVDFGLPQDVIDFLSDINISGLPGSGDPSPSKGFEFGLFDHPEQLLDILLTKKPVDLVTFDVPPLSVGGHFGGFFPVLGPLGFLLQGDLGAKLDIDVGYDTQGLIDKDPTHGFFAKTAAPPSGTLLPWENPKGLAHLPAGSFGVLLKGGAGVGFAGSSLTVNATFGLGLYAYFENANTDGKFRPAVEGFECIFSPIGGRADVGVNVTIEIGFGPFSVSKNIPLAEATLGDFTIFSCPPPSIEATPDAPGLATESAPDLLLNVGDRAGLRKLADDHGNISAPIALSNDPSTPGDESLNEAYVIALARDAGGDNINRAANPAPTIVPGMLDVSAFGFTQRVHIPTNVITADFKDGNDTLIMQTDVNVASNVHGGGGNDVLFGGAARDVFFGDDGNDVLTGNDGNDDLHGGIGNDQLSGGKGADRLDGEDGFDTVDYSGANKDTHQGVSVTITQTGDVSGHGGEAEGDTLISIESLVGTDFNDDFRAGFGVTQKLVFDGGAGSDILIGGKGEDLLIGGAGADHLNGDEAIKPDGTQGYDGTTYITSWGAVDIDLERTSHSIQFGGDAQGDRLYNIEAVEGSINSDSLLGDSKANLLWGNDGNDTIEGRGGMDEVNGGAGDDLIYGDADGDILDGSAGIDTLSYQHVGGPVTVDLGASQVNVLGIPVYVPGAAPDSIKMAIVPNAGGRGLSSFENLIGTNSGDILIGDIGYNRIEGRDGNDGINGGDGDDILVGGAGGDTLIGGRGSDWVYYDDSSTGVTADLVSGGSGGTAQNDVYGTVENILGSLSADSLLGNDVDNIIDPNISGATVTEFVDGRGSFGDTLRLNYSGVGVDIGQGVVGGFDYNTFAGGSFQRLNAAGTATLDTVNFANIERLDVVGTHGADTVFAGYLGDRIVTGAGNDTIFAGNGDDVVYAGSGDDFVAHNHLPVDAAPTVAVFSLNGGRGIDTLSIDLDGATENIFLAGRTDNTEAGVNLRLENGAAVTGFERLKDVATGDGDDVVIQNGDFDNHFSTRNGEDTLLPGLGNDVIDGGDDFTIGKEVEFGSLPGFNFGYSVIDGRSFANNNGDLLVLDYSDVTDGPGVTGHVHERVLDPIFRVITAGDTDIALESSFSTNDGEYSYVAAGDSHQEFSNIERLWVTGSQFGDHLEGTDDSYRFLGFNLPNIAFEEEQALLAANKRGDDLLSGGAGNDVLIGKTGSDELSGGDGDDILIGSDDQDAEAITLDDDLQSEGNDSGEIDILTGGAGADTFVLGVTQIHEGNISSGYFYASYLDETIPNTNRAIITDFNPLEDKLQLSGDASYYTAEVVNAGTADVATLIYHSLPPGREPVQLIAELKGVSGFDFNPATSSYVTYSNAGNFGVGGAGGFPTPAAALAAPAALASLSLESESTSRMAASMAAPLAALATSWVHESSDVGAFKAVFDGTTGGSGSTLSLSGSAEAFGTFDGDPFGLGKGIILSTGRVEDLPGENTVQSGGSNVTSIPITFVKIGRAGGSDIFRADLSNLGVDIRSLKISDANTHSGGAGGIATGFDLDAVALSKTFIDHVTSTTNLNNPTELQQIDAFDFSAAGLAFTPGTQRAPSNGFDNGPTLDGARNVDLVDNDASSLGLFDFGGVGVGSLTMGDGGTLGFQLKAPVSSNGPLYLYVGEEGLTGETVVGSFEVSPDNLQPSGDLSTDLGAAGPEGDSTGLTYTFTPKAGDTAFSVDVVLFSEELPEFDGTSLSDLFSIKLNGKEVGSLSNGAALSIKNLVYGGSGDLILNPVGTGALADVIKADAYTKTLTISGPLDPGVANTLTIEVKDGRDAFLDSGLLIKDGSFKTFVLPEVGIGFDPGAGGSGVGGEGASGTIVVGSHDGHIAVTPPAGASGPVEVIITPSDTIEIPGAGGPGKPATVTFNPGDGPKDVPIQAAPGAGTGDTGTVHYEVVSSDPNVNGQPIAPDVFGFELPANRPPEITSPTGEIHVTENTTNVAQVVAVDPDAGQTLTYSIEGGADKDLFTIDPATGALKFKAAPDFEHPTDTGADNVYDVVVGVKDNGAVLMSDTQALAVRVTDAAETSTFVVKFVSESAGYRNAVGWYNTETLKGGILFPSIEAEGKHPTVIPGVTTASFVVDNADAGKIGFFLIPDGGRVQEDDDRHEHGHDHRDDDDCGDSDHAPGGPIKVVQLANGSWAVALVDAAGNVQTDRHGKPVMLDGVGTNAFFTETGKNAGGVDYASSKVGSGQTAATMAGDTADGPAGPLAWEDQAAHRLSNGSYGKPGDADYNDAVFQVDQVMGQTLNGNDGPNNLNGGIAGDVLYGWGGKDTLDAGAGSDRVSGGDDDDLFIHRIAENAGSSDSYDGGAGMDTLRLVLTGSEWARTNVQADIAKFLAYLDPAQNPAGAAQSFSFKSTDLTTVNIEKLEVVVDGVALDPRNEPVTARNDSLSVTEDAGGSINLLGNDDVPDRAASVSLLSAASRGIVKLTPQLSGAMQQAILSYMPSEALQSLRVGETATDQVTYKAVDVNGDSSTATVAITINGVNDLAEILGKAAGHVAEDSVTKATGKLTIIDVDHGENRAAAQSNTTGNYGSFSIDSSGAWTYVLDNASAKVQGLSCDETVQDSFAVKSLDGTASKMVVITIEGNNDDAVVGSPTVRDVTEDQSVVSGKLTAKGTISISDADHGEAAFQTKVYGSSHNLGSLTLASDGTYTYSVANSAVQNLGTNDTKLDSFNIKALDGTAKTVAFSIHGANELINVGSHATVAATAGPDTFVFASPASAGSTITGFSAGSDLLQISASGFGHGLAANTGASLVNASDHNAAFHAGAGGYFIFDNRGSDAGTVFWDATGGHGDDATALVKLPGMTSLMSSDFHLV